MPNSTRRRFTQQTLWQTNLLRGSRRRCCRTSRRSRGYAMQGLVVRQVGHSPGRAIWHWIESRSEAAAMWLEGALRYDSAGKKRRFWDKLDATDVANVHPINGEPYTVSYARLRHFEMR